MKFWESNKPYELAKVITANHELSTDLVAHVYMDIKDVDADSIEDLFFTYASNQWKWKNSGFNKLYRPYYTDEFQDCHVDEGDIIHQDHFKDFLYKYLDRETHDPVEWYKREIAKMVLSGMTYREIQRATKINIRYITETIKQFRHDVFSNYYSVGGSPDID